MTDLERVIRQCAEDSSGPVPWSELLRFLKRNGLDKGKFYHSLTSIYLEIRGEALKRELREKAKEAYKEFETLGLESCRIPFDFRLHIFPSNHSHSLCNLPREKHQNFPGFRHQIPPCEKCLENLKERHHFDITKLQAFRRRFQEIKGTQ